MYLVCGLVCFSQDFLFLALGRSQFGFKSYFRQSKVKSLVFLDLETTGLSVLHDRIVQICLKRYVVPDYFDNELIVFFIFKCSSWLFFIFRELFQPTNVLNEYVNPGEEVRMSPKSVEITMITDEFLKDKPTFESLGPKIIDFFKRKPKFISHEILIAHNGTHFDFPFLVKEMRRNNLPCHVFYGLKFFDTLLWMRQDPERQGQFYFFFSERVFESFCSWCWNKEKGFSDSDQLVRERIFKRYYFCSWRLGWCFCSCWTRFAWKKSLDQARTLWIFVLVPFHLEKIRIFWIWNCSQETTSSLSNVLLLITK